MKRNKRSTDNPEPDLAKGATPDTASYNGTKKMKIETRTIQEQDHRGILAVVEALTAWFDSDARDRAIPADLRHQYGIVAVSEGKIVGFITLFFAEGRLNIGWMGVRPDYQKGGIGSRLLARAEEFGRQHGMTEIATYTLGDSVDYKPYEETRKFYFKQGFTIYQRNKTDNRGCPEEIKIKKQIAQPGVPGVAGGAPSAETA